MLVLGVRGEFCYLRNVEGGPAAALVVSLRGPIAGTYEPTQNIGVPIKVGQATRYQVFKISSLIIGDGFTLGIAGSVGFFSWCSIRKMIFWIPCGSWGILVAGPWIRQTAWWCLDLVVDQTLDLYSREVAIDSLWGFWKKGLTRLRITCGWQTGSRVSFFRTPGEMSLWDDFRTQEFNLFLQFR
jgi:hypothetical protein